MKTMTDERQIILENYLVLKDALGVTKRQKGELERENLDVKFRIQELEIELLQSKEEVGP